jgi:ankyrin repeat protein
MENSKRSPKKINKKPTKKLPTPPPEDLTLTEKFVWVAHNDLEAVKAMLAQHPHLINATYNEANMETALGAACQVKNIEIIEYLLANGAEMDIFAACVLGKTAEVLKMLEADPKLIKAKNRHGHNHTLLRSAERHPELVALLKDRGAK